jgi:MerR family transcriptional regulator, light-induced transcriptional regulator
MSSNRMNGEFRFGQNRNQQISTIIKNNSAQLLEKVFTRQNEIQPEMQKFYDDIGFENFREGLGYLLGYLNEAISRDDPSLFNNYIQWVKTVLVNRNINLKDLIISLECIGEILEQILPAEMRTVAQEFVNAGVACLLKASTESISFIKREEPLADIAEKYLAAILNDKRDFASSLILDLVKSGTSIKDIYLYVFQSVQYEIGRLWQIHKINVAQEHYATSLTQHIMAQLYPYIKNQSKEYKFLGICVATELHEIGIRMVADFLEMDGWNTYYLGANVYIPDIITIISKYKPDILGISNTITLRITELEKLITFIRNHFNSTELKIIVGGYTFNIAPHLWKNIGADGYAQNAPQAVNLANELMWRRRVNEHQQ